MATIIDALVVTLGLDGTKFKQGQREVDAALNKTRQDANAAAKDIEAAGQRAAEFYRGLRRAALEFFAVMTAGRGMRDIVAGSTEATAQIGRLATNIGMATDQLSAWQGAAERFGGSASATGGALQSLSQQFQQFQLTGQSQVIPFFRAMGVQIADAEGKLRPLGDILLDVADQFKTMTPQRALAFGASLGLDPGTINLLRQGRGAVQGMLSDQRRLGTVTDEQAANAARRRNAWLDLTQAIETAARRIMDGLTPAVTAVLKELTEFVKYLSGENFLPAFRAVESAMKEFAEYLGSPEFRDDIRLFASTMKAATASMLEVLRWLGIIPRPDAGAGPDDMDPATGLPRSLTDPMNGIGPLLPWQYRMGDDPNSGLPGARRRGTLRDSNPGGGFYQPASFGGGSLDPAMVRDRLASALGLSTDQAAGIVSGLNRESGLNPGITRPGGFDFGLAQWTGPRRRALEAFASARGTTRDDAGTQMEFIAHELRTQFPQVLARIRASRTATEAGRAFHDYEAGGAAQFEHLRDWHAADAERFARLPGGRMPETMSGARAAFGGRGLAPGGGNVREVIINGPITIQTQATDAPGIAASLGDAIRRFAFVPQANTGLT